MSRMMMRQIIEWCHTSSNQPLGHLHAHNEIEPPIVSEWLPPQWDAVQDPLEVKHSILEQPKESKTIELALRKFYVLASIHPYHLFEF